VKRKRPGAPLNVTFRARVELMAESKTSLRGPRKAPKVPAQKRMIVDCPTPR